MASRNEYEMLFKLSAQLGQNFNGTFSSAQKTLAATQKEIQSLNKLQSDISSYVKQQQSVDALKNKLSVYQQQLQNIQTELKASGEYNSALANKELELKQRIEQTEAAINQKSQTVSHMGRLCHKPVSTPVTFRLKPRGLGTKFRIFKPKKKKRQKKHRALAMLVQTHSLW